MAYIPGTSIPAPAPFTGSHYVTGSYNNPFEPGSLEYDGYKNTYDYSQKLNTAATNAKNVVDRWIKEPADDLINYVQTLAGKSDDPGYYDSGSASGSPPSTPQELQYIDAPYAELYGMDASTAYQEALANTAYQRKVKDLRAAGLNPVLGISGAGAASFYGTPADSSFGGVSYGSLGSGKSTSSAAETATKLQYWLPTLVNGVTNAVVTLRTGNGMSGYAAGTIAQNTVSGVLGAIRNHSK